MWCCKKVLLALAKMLLPPPLLIIPRFKMDLVGYKRGYRQAPKRSCNSSWWNFSSLIVHGSWREYKMI